MEVKRFRPAKNQHMIEESIANLDKKEILELAFKTLRSNTSSKEESKSSNLVTNL